MRRLLSLVVVLSCVVGQAVAEEPPAPSVGEAAAQVLAALKADDTKRLTELAVAIEPDRWLVAEQLCVLGRADAAGRFAPLGARGDAKALGAHVASWKASADDAATRAALGKAEVALVAKDGAALGAALQGLKGDTTSMLGLRILRLQAIMAAGRGDAAKVTSLVTEAAEGAAALGWQRQAAGAWEIAANHFLSGRAGRDPNKAIAYFTKSAEAWAAIKRPIKRLRMVLNTGQAHFQAGRPPKALEVFEYVEAEGRRIGAHKAVRAAILNRSLWLQTQGRHDEAREASEMVLKLAEEAGDEHAVVKCLLGLSRLAAIQSRHADAGAIATQARVRAEKAGLVDLAATASLSEGMYFFNRGQLKEAQPALEKALAWAREKRDARMAFYALGVLGALYGVLGDSSKSLSMKEDAAEFAKRSGSVLVEAEALLSLGRALAMLGRHDEAAKVLNRGLSISAVIGDPAMSTKALTILAVIASQRKDSAAVADLVARARKFPPSAANKPTLVTLLEAAAQVSSANGDFDGAHAHLDEATRIIDDGKLHESYRIGIYRGRGNIASDQDDDKARREWYEKMLAVAREYGTPGGIQEALGPVADARLRTGDAVGALAAADELVVLMKRHYGGHSDVGAAAIRERRSLTYEVGALAAAKLKDIEAYHRFVEEGRAGALLQGLGGREAVEALTLPAGLRAALQTARRQEAAAVKQAKAKPSDASFGVAVAAREALRKLIDRVQRDARRTAEVAYPKIATRAEVQAALVAGEVLVQYSLFRHRATAEVVTPEGTRVVDLGSPKPIEEAVEELLDDEGHNLTPVRVAKLHALLLDPLTLPAGTKRMLISPAAGLAYVPFGLLMPDHDVALVPSGTTLRILQSARHQEPTRRVLALGNPDYSDRKGLVPLPGSGAEATSVGDVVLLGGKATEAGLRAALETNARWRALHIACHGRIHPSQPLFSALAITAGAGEDGLLTVHEILDLKIEADAVVLSACETARGRAYEAEGVLGFTRAFMYAGAPRVLCSLWPVHDRATQALMTRFYALWNPQDPAKGIGAAAALRQAQAYVRDFEQKEVDAEASRKAGSPVMKTTRPWKDPYYWAAWVLWGLPD